MNYLLYQVTPREGMPATTANCRMRNTKQDILCRAKLDPKAEVEITRPDPASSSARRHRPQLVENHVQMLKSRQRREQCLRTKHTPDSRRSSTPELTLPPPSQQDKANKVVSDTTPSLSTESQLQESSKPTARAESTLCCSDCPITASLWRCLACDFIACGRYEEGHAKDHWAEIGHRCSVSVEDGSVWDYDHDCWAAEKVGDEHEVTDKDQIEVEALQGQVPVPPPHKGGLMPCTFPDSCPVHAGHAEAYGDRMLLSGGAMLGGEDGYSTCPDVILTPSSDGEENDLEFQSVDLDVNLYHGVWRSIDPDSLNIGWKRRPSGREITNEPISKHGEDESCKSREQRGEGKEDRKPVNQGHTPNNETGRSHEPTTSNQTNDATRAQQDKYASGFRRVFDTDGPFKPRTKSEEEARKKSRRDAFRNFRDGRAIEDARGSEFDRVGDHSYQDETAMLRGLSHGKKDCVRRHRGVKIEEGAIVPATLKTSRFNSRIPRPSAIIRGEPRISHPSTSDTAQEKSEPIGEDMPGSTRENTTRSTRQDLPESIEEGIPQSTRAETPQPTTSDPTQEEKPDDGFDSFSSLSLPLKFLYILTTTIILYAFIILHTQVTVIFSNKLHFFATNHVTGELLYQEFWGFEFLWFVGWRVVGLVVTALVTPVLFGGLLLGWKGSGDGSGWCYDVDVPMSMSQER